MSAVSGMGAVGAMPVDGLSDQPLGWNYGVDLNLVSGFEILDPLTRGVALGCVI